MPDETNPRPSANGPAVSPGGGEENDWIFKPIDGRSHETTSAESAPQLERSRGGNRRRGHAPGPKKMFHPEGRFRDESGNRFDYIFPELLEDPALPPWIFERVPFLLRGTADRFQPRRATREEERIVVGLRYGYGDLPRTADRG